MDHLFEVIATVRGEERRVWIDHTQAIKVSNDLTQQEHLPEWRQPMFLFDRPSAAVIATIVRNTLNVGSVEVRLYGK